MEFPPSDFKSLVATSFATPGSSQNLVERAGFEPTRFLRPDLQSGGFNHPPISPHLSHETGFEPVIFRVTGGRIRPAMLFVLMLGASRRHRTLDLPLTRRMLCHLSYAG